MKIKTLILKGKIAAAGKLSGFSISEDYYAGRSRRFKSRFFEKQNPCLGAAKTFRLHPNTRRDGRAVDCGGLENR